jgi:tetratricopeptide (TPR) repeat protein
LRVRFSDPRKTESAVVIALVSALFVSLLAAPAAPAQQKTISDPAEYASYMNTREQTEPQAKAEALEKFVGDFPKSVMAPSALETLAETYQKMGKLDKANEAAKRALEADPNDLTLLKKLINLKQPPATAKAPSLADSEQFARTALQIVSAARKPVGMSDLDFQQLKSERVLRLNRLLGTVELEKKDYAAAQPPLQAVLDANLRTTEATDVYYLAQAYLEATPPNNVQGLWYAARAVALVGDPQKKKSILEYGKSHYVKYHGSEQGWADLLQAAAAGPAQPPNLSQLITAGSAKGGAK